MMVGEDWNTLSELASPMPLNLFSPSARGNERLPADCPLYTQQDRGWATLRGLNYRFTATFLWSAPEASAASSGRADSPYTAGLGWSRVLPNAARDTFQDTKGI